MLEYNNNNNTHLMVLFWDYRLSQYQKGKTNLDFPEVRDIEWHGHQLDHMQICTLPYASTPPFSFLQARCPSCHPTSSIKALKAYI